MAMRKQVADGRSWVRQLFLGAQAQRRGIVRRTVHSVARFASEALLLEEARARRFPVLRIDDQYFVICDSRAIVLAP